jgi:hypothetical protein
MLMSSTSPLTYKVVAYQAVNNFNMDEAVDWAAEMIEVGFDTESLLILAGLVKPVNYFETVNFLDGAINELGLRLRTGDDGIISYCSYYVKQIAQGIDIRLGLQIICQYVIDFDYHSSIYDFCNLSWAWDDMDWNDGMQWYWDGATADNIEQIAIDTAKQWLNDNIASYEQRILL